MQHTLERHKAFPVIAWATVILFAALTYYLAYRLNTETNVFASQRTNTEAALQSDLRSGTITY